MKTVFVIVALFIILASCDRPNCKNTNPIFDDYSPESQIYKNELFSSINNSKIRDFRFWFKDLKQINGIQELQFDIQNENICAVISMEFPQIENLNTLIQKNGNSYHGAEFKNLKFKSIQDSNFIKFVLIDFDEIID